MLEKTLQPFCLGETVVDQNKDFQFFLDSPEQLW